MLSIDTLGVNKEIFNPNPEDQSNALGIWDLTKSSIDYNIGYLNARKIYTVPEGMEMRPDLISLYNVGDSQYCGSIMKVNGISNPFAIDSGQSLFMLTREVIHKTYDRKKQQNTVVNSGQNPAFETLKKTQEDKKFKVSEGRKKFLDKAIKNKPALVLPPNVSQPGDRKYSRKGKVFTFAPDSGKGGFNRPLR